VRERSNRNAVGVVGSRRELSVSYVFQVSHPIRSTTRIHQSKKKNPSLSLIKSTEKAAEEVAVDVCLVN
jgi:hypothetical protein